MSIWFNNYSLDELNKFSKNTMLNHLGISITEIGDNFLKGRMPVDHRTKQPAGILHGGASVALAESLGSIAAFMTVDSAKRNAVGVEINANHIRSVSDGYVEGIARPIHIGRRTQVWEIKIFNPTEKIVCVSRITMAIVEKPL